MLPLQLLVPLSLLIQDQAAIYFRLLYPRGVYKSLHYLGYISFYSVLFPCLFVFPSTAICLYLYICFYVILFFLEHFFKVLLALAHRAEYIVLLVQQLYQIDSNHVADFQAQV